MAQEDGQTRWGVLGLAVGLSLLVGWAGPAPWPAGEGRLILRLRDGGQTLLDGPVSLGEGLPVVLSGAGVAASLPGGVPLAGEVEVQLEGDALPALGAARLTLQLPDGREELLPLVEAGVARRRPLGPARIVLGVLSAVVVLWVSEALPLFVTALLVPVVLVAAGVQGTEAALAPFASPIIALFFGGFLLAEAMKRVALDRLVAVQVVGRLGRSPVLLFAACLLVSGFLSMWMSNTAAVAVLIPVALATTAPLRDPAYQKTLVLGIAYMATLGGVGSAIGTPANPMAMAFLETYAGREISFVGWFAYGLPVVVLLAPVIGGWLWWRDRPQVDAQTFAAARALAVAEVVRAERLTGPQRVVLGVFAGVMVLWLTQSLHGVSASVVALAGAAALAALGQVRSADLQAISWGSLLTFGGGLAIGEALVDSGASDWIATRLEGLSALPPQASIAAVGFLALALTTVASNTASAAVLIPLSLPLAGVVGADPAALVLVVAVASSIDFALVIGTPPTMMAYATGLFTPREIFEKGIVLDILGLLLLVTVIVGWWQATGLL